MKDQDVQVNSNQQPTDSDTITNEASAETAESATASSAASTAADTLQAQIASLKQDGWQRSRAEFTNYKRRVTQELADSRERGAMDLLAKFLPIFDDFERALGSIPQDFQGHSWTNGTSLILRNMRKILDEYNVSEIDPVGEEFNPNLHEAIGMEDSSEYESGIVTVTLQKGFRSGDRVLRPALVRVAN
jgi:molecular chaperone GrpE